MDWESCLPLTISVIPSLARTRYAIEGAHPRNKEAILHVPMEAEEEPQDGPSVLTTMSDEEITILLNDYLDDNPGVVGINNHMGSKATRDPRVMTAVISVLKRRDLFFFDSLTSTKSIAYNTAKSMSVPTTRNDMFLDADTEDAKVVEERLQSLIRLARRKGVAVGIGHPKRWTCDFRRRAGRRHRLPLLARLHARPSQAAPGPRWRQTPDRRNCSTSGTTGWPRQRPPAHGTRTAGSIHVRPARLPG